MNGPALLRRWREDHELSQARLAEKIGANTTAASVCEWEGGDKAPRAETLIRIEVLTDGAVPIESWTDDAEVREAMRVVLNRRAKLPRRPRTKAA